MMASIAGDDHIPSSEALSRPAAGATVAKRVSRKELVVKAPIDKQVKAACLPPEADARKANRKRRRSAIDSSLDYLDEDDEAPPAKRHHIGSSVDSSHPRFLQTNSLDPTPHRFATGMSLARILQERDKRYKRERQQLEDRYEADVRLLTTACEEDLRSAEEAFEKEYAKLAAEHKKKEVELLRRIGELEDTIAELKGVLDGQGAPAQNHAVNGVVGAGEREVSSGGDAPLLHALHRSAALSNGSTAVPAGPQKEADSQPLLSQAAPNGQPLPIAEGDHSANGASVVVAAPGATDADDADADADGVAPAEWRLVLTTGESPTAVAAATTSVSSASSSSSSSSSFSPSLLSSSAATVLAGLAVEREDALRALRDAQLLSASAVDRACRAEEQLEVAEGEMKRLAQERDDAVARAARSEARLQRALKYADWWRVHGNQVGRLQPEASPTKVAT